MKEIINNIINDVRKARKKSEFAEPEEDFDLGAVGEVLDETPQYIYDLIQLSIHASKQDYKHLEDDMEKALKKGAPADEVVKSLTRSKNELFSVLETDEQKKMFTRIIEYLNQKKPEKPE